MTLDEARRALGMPPAEEWAKAVDAVYPVRITPYYLGLIDRNSPEDDPVYRQCFPAAAELTDDLPEDGLGEEPQTVVPHLIHRYRDRVLLLATANCSMHCRFCFRKRRWRSDVHAPELSDAALREVCRYLAAHPEVREVLVSGGDPLTLGTARLRTILDALSVIPSIDVLRIGTRLLTVDPDKIDGEMTEMLAQYSSLWIMSHFNHPREVTEKATDAIRRITRAGIPILNQTVLLKGVNNDAKVLEELFRKLVKCRVKPHYLFHVDPVKGVRHFGTGVTAGLSILRAFRPTLSSLAVPTFAIDLPCGGGKVNLQPDYHTAPGTYRNIQDDADIAYYGDTL